MLKSYFFLAAGWFARVLRYVDVILMDASGDRRHRTYQYLDFLMQTETRDSLSKHGQVSFQPWNLLRRSAFIVE